MRVLIRRAVQVGTEFVALRTVGDHGSRETYRGLKLNNMKELTEVLVPKLD